MRDRHCGIEPEGAFFFCGIRPDDHGIGPDGYGIEPDVGRDTTGQCAGYDRKFDGIGPDANATLCRYLIEKT